MPYDVSTTSAVEPEVIAVPERLGESAPESASGDHEQQPDEQQQGKPKSGFQKRIDRLTRSIGDRDRYIQYLESEIASRVGPASRASSASQADGRYSGDAAGDGRQAGDGSYAGDGRPHPDHYETQGDYLEALTEWKTDQRIRHAEEQRQQQEAHRAHHAQFQEKQQSFRESTPDYDDVLVDSEAPVSPAMAEEIRGHEHGPALMYFLAKHPEVAEHLAALSPTALAREIGRLELQFMPQSDSPLAKRPAATVSRAPKPPSRVGQTSQTGDRDPGEMSPTEYREWRRKQFPGL